MYNRATSWPERPLGELLDIARQTVTPGAYPAEQFVHYSIPAWDATRGPALEIGASIGSAKICIKQPTILVSKLNPRIPRVVLVESPIGQRHCASTEFIPYVAQADSVSLRFYKWFLQSLMFQRRLERIATGSTNSHTRAHPAETLKWNVPAPTPEEQYRIAAVLDTVDEAIVKTEAAIVKLKQVRAGLLHDLLTRGIDENGQLRDAIAHPEQFQDSPLGCIPRAWQCKTLEEAADWYSGGTPSRSQAAWWQGDVPILTPKDMKVFELSDTIEHVTEEAAQMGSKVMPASTAFIVVRGMILAHTFPVCLSTRPLAFNQDIKAVCGRGELSTRFLAHWFAANSALFLRKATEATHGTKKLDSNELHRIRIAIPSPEEQQAIVKRIEAIDANIAVESDKHAKLGLVKSGLMSDLLTGRVRLPEEIAVAS